jgi:hypothetical protein
MSDFQTPELLPEKPTERYYRLSRENFEEFLKKIGYHEREDRRWELSRKGKSKAETLGVTDEQVVLDIDKLLRNRKKLRMFIRYHWSDLPLPP